MAVPAPRDPSLKDVSCMQSPPISPPKSQESAKRDEVHMSTWVCLGCGYHYLDDGRPDRCPRCTGEQFLFTSQGDSGN